MAVTAAPMDTEQLAGHALLHLQGLLNAAGLSAEAMVESRDGDALTLAVTGSDAGLLVGHHGQVLDALQYLLSLMTNKGRDQRLRLTVDADGYRARRSQMLIQFAQQLAEQVAGSGEEAVTDPLNPMERRIIHTALVDHPNVRTYSEGEEPNRYVVISPQSVAQP